MNDTVVIVTGAAPLDARAVAAIPSDAIVIAADGGLDHARAAGLTPAGLIGDLDSVSEEGLAWAKQHATIQRHPIDKDATDTELAVAFAAGMNPARVVMVAGGGDRLDHTLAAIGALGASVLTSVPLIECWWGGQYLQVVHGPARVSIRTATSVGATRPGVRDADLAAGDARAVHRRHVVGHAMAARPGRAQAARRSRSEQHRDRIGRRGLALDRDPHRVRRSTARVGEPAMRRVTRRRIALGATLASVLVACGGRLVDVAVGDHRRLAATDGPPEAVTLVAYDSFPTEGTALNDALAEFTDDTGIAVELLIAGDTGSMLSKAALTAGNPEGDVMWGVDNTYLSRAVDAGVFAPYESPALDAIPADLRGSSPTSRRRRSTSATSVSTTTSAGSPSISSTRRPGSTTCCEPEYADLLVVENPATSSPGLAFLLATIAAYGDGWRDYWTSLTAQRRRGGRRLDRGLLRALLVDGWRPRPLVVSYASSPPAEVIFADPPRTDAPTAVVTSTCFRQIEFAGVLDGTDCTRRGPGARRLPRLGAVPA